MVKRTIYTTALILCVSVLHSVAEEYNTIKIEPGNYEFTETSSSSQDSEQKEKKVKRCVNEKILDPAGEMAKRQGCTISNYKGKGDKVSFDFVCDKGKGVNTKGSVEYSGSGKEFMLKKTVETEISEDKTFSVTGSGKAVRVGECN